MGTTPFQLLAQFQRATGEQVRLKRYDTIEAVDILPERISLLITVYRFKELTREDRITHRGQRLISYTNGPHGLTRRELTVWDEDFQPTIMRHWGRTQTVTEYYERRDWEDICYRPGDDSRFGQRDSARVQADLAEDRLNARLFATSTTLPARPSTSTEA